MANFLHIHTHTCARVRLYIYKRTRASGSCLFSQKTSATHTVWRGKKYVTNKICICVRHKKKVNGLLSLGEGSYKGRGFIHAENNRKNI